jgi:hypothetical protein
MRRPAMRGMNKVLLTIAMVVTMVVVSYRDAGAKTAMIRHTEEGYRVTYYGTNRSCLSWFYPLEGYRYSLAPLPYCRPLYTVSYGYVWSNSYTVYPYTYAHYPYAFSPY